MTGGAGLFDARDDIAGAAVHVGAQSLDVRDVDRQLRAAADVQHFLDRTHEPQRIARLVAVMGVVDAAADRRLARQRHHFVGGREALRCIEQAGRQSERAFAHGAGDQRAHGLQFGGVGRARVVPEHARAHRAEAHVGGHVGSGAGGLECRARAGHVRRAVAVDADEDRGHALVQPRQDAPHRRVVGTQVGVGMRVRIDQARCDHKAAGIDLACRAVAAAQCRADVENAVAADRDVGDAAIAVAAIEQQAAVDHGVCRLHGGRCGQRARCGAAGEQQQAGQAARQRAQSR